MLKKYVRAEVTPGFIEVMKEIVRAKIARFTEESLYQPASTRQIYMNKKAPVVSRLIRLRTSQGRDLEITRLRSLDFASYQVVEYEGKPWLAGQTNDIIMYKWNSEQPPDASGERWNMGPYTIYLPVEDIINGITTNFHFVPEREPLTQYRHPHHKGYPTNPGLPRSPFELLPSTCWGSFGTIVTGCVSDCDLVETFRALHAYLGRYNTRSPLGAGVECCNFARRIYGRQHARAY